MRGVAGGSPALLTCEHGGKRVPARWSDLFRAAEARAALESHRGWDPGALPLARRLARALDAPLLATTVTRLLVEPNRSPGHPRLFSPFVEDLPPGERELILARHYRPHRERVEAAAAKAIGTSGSVLHLGVHTFTPVLDGVERTVDVGLLYDPTRPRERELCAAWAVRLRRAAPELSIRRNAPYRGSADGLTTWLRRRLGPSYLGVEIEVSQALVARGARGRGRIASLLARTLREA